jgi:hypothetical protein
MKIIYFLRPNINPHRIFIGITYCDKMYRIGFKTRIYNNKLRMIRHYYEINEEINIIDTPDMSLIDKKDLSYINFLNIKIYKNIYLKIYKNF